MRWRDVSYTLRISLHARPPLWFSIKPVSDLPWPNGLTFSGDNTKLCVAEADVDNPDWHVFDVSEDGGLSNQNVFSDAGSMYEVRLFLGTTHRED